MKLKIDKILSFNDEPNLVLCHNDDETAKWYVFYLLNQSTGEYLGRSIQRESLIKFLRGVIDLRRLFEGKEHGEENIYIGAVKDGEFLSKIYQGKLDDIILPLHEFYVNEWELSQNIIMKFIRENSKREKMDKQKEQKEQKVSELGVIWKYDLFPYMNTGKVKMIGKSGRVLTELGSVNPIKVMPYEDVVNLQAELDKLKSEYDNDMKELKKKYDEKLNSLKCRYWI